MALLMYLFYGLLTALIAVGLVSLYRLYLHPLANVPGPKFAAVSRFYEWYSDCIQPAIYCWKIEDWHKTYGPIVRIGPNEVHIDDPDYFDVLYSPNAKLDKDPWYYGFVGSNDSAFATVEHDIHRIKRSKQNPFFSRQNVDKSAPMLNRILENMFTQFETYRVNGKPLPIRNALKCFTLDAVCEYCFPSGMEFIKSPDFAATFHAGQETFSRMFPWFRHFPRLAAIMIATPDWVAPYLDKSIQAAMSFVDFIEAQVQESIRQSKEQEMVSRKTIIRELYESDMPPELRTKQVLEAEATALVSAASFTTSRFIEVSMFHILTNPLIARKLTEELRALKPKDYRHDELLTHRELETLPYLGAIFLETQRMVPGLKSRFPRLVSKSQKAMAYNSYQLPPGTVISMSVWDTLLSERVWGDTTHTFNPSRWLDPSSSSPVSISSSYKAKMGKYLPAFGRGSRNCIGQNLATAEFYIVMGNLFRSFDIELFDTDVKEVEVVQDCFAALTYKGSTGVRVLLK